MELKRMEQAREQAQKFRAHQKRERKTEPTTPVKDVPFTTGSSSNEKGE